VGLSLIGLVLLVAGCAAPRFSMMIESEPAGARVFWSAGANEARATTRNYIGQTPCTWEGECEGDNTFKAPGISVYSSFVPGAVVIEAEPPSGTTNLFPQRQVFHTSVHFHDGDKIPAKLFFDLAKPSPALPAK
jgi:hypothetical protein